MGKLIPAAVIYCNEDDHFVVYRGLALDLFHFRSEVLREYGLIAEKDHSCIISDELLHIVEITVEDLHKSVDLFLRTLPVLGRKGIEGDIFQTDVLAVMRDLAEGLSALPVTKRTRKSALFSPSAVAVHNESNVLRENLGEFILCFLFFSK